MIQDVPKIIDGGESEDENDYEPEEPIEEEFDLNDIMGEETEDATLGLTRAEIAELERKKEEEELAEAARVKEEEKKQQQKSSGKKKKKKGKKGKKKKEDL
jgi:predicted secreted protein